MIKAILIDDEEIALKSLENKIRSNIPYIDIIFTTQDPEVGILRINELKPDLLFLDIDMPVISGFDLLSKIFVPDMEVIFVTAHFNYAITAIKHDAIDYILKPIDTEELMEAANKARKNIQEKKALLSQISVLTKGVKPISSVVIPIQSGLSFFKPNQIIRLEGNDGYTNIHVSDGNILLSSASIGKFGTILENHNFFQTHKSHIVNMDFVKTYHSEGTLELTNGECVPLSKARRKLFLEQFS